MSNKQPLAPLPEWVRNPDPSIYLGDNYLVLDFETTTEYKGSPLVEGNRIVLSCWKSGRTGKIESVFGSEYEQGRLVEACSQVSFIVAHNAKFELGWLRRCGVDLRKIIVFDTILAEYVLGGNRYFPNQLSLNECLKRRGLSEKEDTVGKMIKAGLPVEDIPQSWLLKYCIRDVEAAEELFLSQRQELIEKGLAAVHYQRCLVTPALADLEFNGMQLDKEKVYALVKEKEEAYYRLTSELQEFCEGAEPSSPKQLREFVYGNLGFEPPKDYKGQPILSDSGAPSVAAPVMALLTPRTAKQREFLDKYREWAELNSDVTKYLRKFRECCDEADGLLRATFNQTNTRTHRLSSSGLEYKVQFQNLNRDFKPIFCSRNAGWVVGEADGAQLEFRVAVHLGKDRVGLSDIVNDADIHAYTASILNGVRLSSVTRDQRQAAKPHTFKPLYGGKSGTEREQAYYRAFAEKYSNIADTQRGWTNTVLNTKRLVTEWGMIYYWPDTKLTQSGYITNSTSIYNYPVQALATAEIIPCALVAAWHRMAGWKGFLVNTVHDSIIAELPPEEVDSWHKLSQQCLIGDAYEMVAKLYKVRLTVPLGAGVLIGRNWSDKEAKDNETVYNADEKYWKEAATEAGMI